METFVVRIYRHSFGQPDEIVGLIEHVKTGKKSRFENTEELSSIICNDCGGNHEVSPKHTQRR